MTDQPDLVVAVRRLTRAVWCLAAVVAFLMVLFLWPYVGFWLRKGEASVAPATAAAAPAAVSYDPSEDNDFHARRVPSKVERATAILLTRRESRGGKHVAVVSEFVKKAPGVELYYEVGDEYSPFAHAPAPECDDCEGDGEVVFFTGNPAMMRESVSYRDGRVDSLGGMPLDELRRLAAKAG
jgi:hypothetical protein